MSLTQLTSASKFVDIFWLCDDHQILHFVCKVLVLLNSNEPAIMLLPYVLLSCKYHQHKHNLKNFKKFSWTDFNGKFDIIMVIAEPIEKNMFNIFLLSVIYIIDKSLVKYTFKWCYYFIFHLNHINVTKSNTYQSCHCTSINWLLKLL